MLHHSPPLPSIRPPPRVAPLQVRKHQVLMAFRDLSVTPMVRTGAVRMTKKEWQEFGTVRSSGWTIIRSLVHRAIPVRWCMQSSLVFTYHLVYIWGHQKRGGLRMLSRLPVAVLSLLRPSRMVDCKKDWSLSSHRHDGQSFLSKESEEPSFVLIPLDALKLASAKTPRRSMCEAMEEIIHELAKVL